MNDSSFKRSLATSTVVHALVVLAVIIYPLVKRLIHPRKPPEMVTFIDLTAIPSPPPSPQIEASAPEPEPPKPQPQPEPELEKPKPSPISEKPPDKTPERPKSEPNKIKVSTNKIVRKVEPQKQTQRQSAQTKLSQEQIRKLLEANIKFSPGGTPSTNFSDLSLYYATVYDAMYGAWKQPGSAAMGLTAQVSIRVQRNGTITNPGLIRSSGSKVMDDSVMEAVRRVARLRPLPAEIRESSLDITIEFVVGQ